MIWCKVRSTTESLIREKQSSQCFVIFHITWYNAVVVKFSRNFFSAFPTGSLVPRGSFIHQPVDLGFAPNFPLVVVWFFSVVWPFPFSIRLYFWCLRIERVSLAGLFVRQISSLSFLNWEGCLLLSRPSCRVGSPSFWARWWPPIYDLNQYGLYFDFLLLS